MDDQVKPVSKVKKKISTSLLLLTYNINNKNNNIDFFFLCISNTINSLALT